MNIEKVVVIGAGQMGTGIAQVMAQSGLHVILNDLSDEHVQKGLGVIYNQLQRDVKKGRKTEEEKQEILERIQLSSNLSEATDVQFVIEAATEKLEVKKQIFKYLDEIVPNGAILASNTSSISITEIAAVTKRPELVIGMHFFNPVPVMKLVEIIRGLATSDKTYEMIKSLTRTIEKEPVGVKDFPGFAANRILVPMINEAIFCIYEGVSTSEEIDNVMKLGMNHPMGPLQLADFIGLDTVLSIMEVLHDGYGDPKYRPCPLLQQYVKAGWLGKKTGRGFYIYEGGK
ncbi:3-hydroxybutyryl-CoA dehydrogenase [Metabacillus herbersteinensis]|uniref:3-hydroxybutyryl-CoA dehydrogenase n=1 Tax=Metabacillus herbersteinensis TaxID=283816 RepID=A0ABV6GK29_9BACI